ncbi:hypothetical protein GN956_G5481 [Arapaima gigas]
MRLQEGGRSGERRGAPRRGVRGLGLLLFFGVPRPLRHIHLLGKQHAPADVRRTGGGFASSRARGVEVEKTVFAANVSLT